MIVSVPATSANLGPGFDSLGLALGMRNEFSIKPSSFTSISIKGEGSRNPKLRADNIFVHIFSDLYEKLVGKRDHFRFSFANQIPISRGLGSSSAIVVGAIAAAYASAKVPLTKEELLNIAIAYETHPDNITPAAMGGFNVAILEEDRVVSRKKNIPDSVVAVMVIPSRSTSTNRSRQSLPKKYSRQDAVFNLSHAAMVTAAFFSEDWNLLRLAAQDRIHQEMRMKQMPMLFEVQRVALEGGALMSTLSGSGSSFFNLVAKEDAPKLKERLEARFERLRVEVMPFDNDGVTILG